MQVESVARCTILDLTWVQVKGILANLTLHRRLERGKGLSHSDIIRLQKLADGERAGDGASEPTSGNPRGSTFR